MIVSVVLPIQVKLCSLGIMLNATHLQNFFLWGPGKLWEVCICQNGLDDMCIFWSVCSYRALLKSSDQVSAHVCEANNLYLFPGSFSDKHGQKVKCKRNVPTEKKKEKKKWVRWIWSVNFKANCNIDCKKKKLRCTVFCILFLISVAGWNT